MGETKQLNFTYDPIVLTKLLLQMYAEQVIEGNTFKARQFACYEYLRTQTDEECESLVQEYAEQENLSVITYDNWKEDCRIMFEIIEQKKRFKEQLFQYQVDGYGATGLGVADMTDKTFYDCEFAHHWETVMEIIREKYSHMTYQELDGVDGFIMKNLKLVGSDRAMKTNLVNLQWSLGRRG